MDFSVRKVVQQLRFYQQCVKKRSSGAFLYIFEAFSNDKNIYMLNVSNKTWINENDIVEELHFPDMTCRGNQYKFDSEL